MRTTSLCTIVLAAVLTVAASTVSAQQDRWDNHTNTMYVSALADAGDRLWVGTPNGLIGLDKATGRCTAFTKANTDMVDNGVNDLAIDNAGRLWMALGRYGNITIPTAFSVYDGTSMRAYRPYLSTAIRMAIGGDGRIWCGTSTQGNVYQLEDEQLAVIADTWRLGNNVAKLVTDTRNRLWGFFDYSGQIALLSDTGWIKLTPLQMGLSDGVVTTIAPDEAGGILVAGRKGLVRHNGTLGATLLPAQSGPKDTTVLLVRSDNRNRIWVITPGEVGILDGGVWSLRDRAALGLADLKVTALIVDAEGVGWIGTDTGVVRYDGATARHYSTQVNGMPGNHVRAISFDHDGTAWIGTWSGAASFNGATWTTFTSLNSPLPDNHVNDLTIARDGGVWFATDSGVAAFERGSWRTFTWKNAPIPAGTVDAIEFDRAGNCWAAILGDSTVGFVVARFDGTTWTLFTKDNSPLIGEGSDAIVVDSTGNVWLTMRYQGIARYDGTTWATYLETDLKESLRSANCLGVDRNGLLMIGTTLSGMFTLDGAGTWDRLQTGNGALSDNEVSAVTVDASNKLWIGFSGGMGKNQGVQHDRGNARTVYKRDNSDLPDGNIMDIAFDRGGGVWIATREGIGVLNNGLVSAVPLPSFDGRDANAGMIIAPNPTHGHMNITYSITGNNGAQVRISVVDALGRTVMTVVEGQRHPGTHTTMIETSALSPGWYGVLLRCGDITLTRPLVVKGH